MSIQRTLHMSPLWLAGWEPPVPHVSLNLAEHVPPSRPEDGRTEQGKASGTAAIEIHGSRKGDAGGRGCRGGRGGGWLTCQSSAASASAPCLLLTASCSERSAAVHSWWQVAARTAARLRIISPAGDTSRILAAKVCWAAGGRPPRQSRPPPQNHHHDHHHSHRESHRTDGGVGCGQG